MARLTSYQDKLADSRSGDSGDAVKVLGAYSRTGNPKISSLTQPNSACHRDAKSVTRRVWPFPHRYHLVAVVPDVRDVSHHVRYEGFRVSRPFSYRHLHLTSRHQ